MRDARRLKIVGAVAVSLTLLIAIVLTLLAKHVITFQMAFLMLIGLFGLYVGFGVLAAIWRFVGKLK